MKLKNVFSLLAALVVLCVGAMAVMKAVLLFKTLTLWNIIM